MKKNDIIRSGRDVLEIEARSITGLIPTLDQDFIQAVELIDRAKSRVIVTGMGKSGLVGRKIAATLASCGTPAIFVHPAEAGHGDLGMILKGDVILAISYSGETREILSFMGFIKRIGVKLIAITGERNSRLARYSDVVLDARVEREAGPGNVVPTASSTAALALGDALAITLMKKRGFDEKDFAFVHPRGSLGKRLMKVESLMHSAAEVPVVRADIDMLSVVEEMTAKKLGMTCVVDGEDNLAGIITDGDLRRMMRKYKQGLLRKRARECMSPNPITIGRDHLAAEALKLMEDRKITALIVKNSRGKVEGVIHLHDLWRTGMF